MNEQPNWLTYVLGVLMALLASMFEVYRRRVDRINEEHVTREDFKYYMDQVREDRLEMHKENITRLEGIHEDIDRVHTRIDQVFSKK